MLLQLYNVYVHQVIRLEQKNSKSSNKIERKKIKCNIWLYRNWIKSTLNLLVLEKLVGIWGKILTQNTIVRTKSRAHIAWDWSSSTTKRMFDVCMADPDLIPGTSDGPQVYQERFMSTESEFPGAPPGVTPQTIKILS